MREKRRFIRFDVSLKVNYVVQKEPKTEKTGITKNLSAGGIQLLTKEKLTTGNKVELMIFTPESLNPAHLNGIVLWSNEISEEKASYASGIEFGKIEEDNKNTFLRFLCELMYKKIGE
ncbi:MAG: PilZ domain-containing protein [Candidatus Omnitrophica bacterium]|nr:PilZ domain-containing protein [Candidatus Omnitrophota bacterium]MBU4589465.1 PilZ domain-containing protein [Candidatus Omnitrophota bacterium]